MVYEEILVDGKVERIVVKTPDSINPDIEPNETDLEQTTDLSDLFEDTLVLEPINEQN